MLSPENRLQRSADFAHVVKHGAKTKRGRIIVYSAPATESHAQARVGLIVSKAVGNSVVRHQLSRRLRHSCRRVLASMNPSHDYVVRALPGSQLVNSAALDEWMAEALAALVAHSAKSTKSTERSETSKCSKSTPMEEDAHV